MTENVGRGIAQSYRLTAFPKGPLRRTLSSRNGSSPADPLAGERVQIETLKGPDSSPKGSSPPDPYRDSQKEQRRDGAAAAPRRAAVARDEPRAITDDVSYFPGSGTIRDHHATDHAPRSTDETDDLREHLAAIRAQFRPIDKNPATKEAP
jgi:hypothetical protein